MCWSWYDSGQKRPQHHKESVLSVLSKDNLIRDTYN